MDYKIDLDVEYIYIINEDLKMSAGKIASQVSHVAMMMGVDSIYQYNTYDLPTLDIDYRYILGKSVILKASSKLFNEIIENEFKESYHLYYVRGGDAGRTEIPKGTISCIGFIYPSKYDWEKKGTKKLRELTKKLSKV